MTTCLARAAPSGPSCCELLGNLFFSLRICRSVFNRLDKNAAIRKNYYFLHACMLALLKGARNSPDGATSRKYVGIQVAQGTPWKEEAFLLKATGFSHSRRKALNNCLCAGRFFRSIRAHEDSRGGRAQCLQHLWTEAVAAKSLDAGWIVPNAGEWPRRRGERIQPDAPAPERQV